MSWLQRLEYIDFEIITGDGKSWKPLWKDFVKNINFNTEGFDFIGVDGTYVGRKRKSGNQYPLLFYFQGENCIDEAEAFEKSTKDSRAWIIKHPFLGSIKAQPISLQFDYTSYNTVKVTGTVWETISKKYPQSVELPSSVVNELKDNIDTSITSISDVSKIPISSENIQSGKGIVNDISNEYKLIAFKGSYLSSLIDLTRTAASAAENIISDYTNYINQTIALINFPFQVAQSIVSKLNAMNEAIGKLRVLLSSNSKDAEMFEVLAGSLVADAGRNSVNASYDNVTESLNTIDLLFNIYETYTNALEGSVKIPDGNLAQILDNLINTAISNLFEIAFEARQERRVILLKDSCAILLAHKYYGPGDDNLDDFINKNNISLDEYLIISKGREIVYFV